MLLSGMCPLRAIVSVCVAFGLLTDPLAPAQTSDPKAAKQVLDGYSTVIGKIYPAAGAFFAAVTDLLDLAGYFGTAPDPLPRIYARLDALQAQIKRLQEAVDLLRGDHLRERNQQRLWRLRDTRDQLEAIVSALQQKPADPAMKTLLVGQAQAETEKFLDLELWTWSDIAVRDHRWPPIGASKLVNAGTMLEPDFKPMPTLEYYTMGLLVWMIALEHATGGDRAEVARIAGPKLEKHLAFLSMRPGWVSSQPPQTLPEHLSVRITGVYDPEQYPRQRVCTIDEYLQDDVARQFRYVQALTYTTATDNELCNVPPGLANRASAAEEEQIRNSGGDVMAALARKLTRLKDHGTVREPFTGTFDPTTATAGYLYTVEASGNLRWQQHPVQTRFVAPQDASRPGGTSQPVEQHTPGPLGPSKTVGIGWNVKHVFADSQGVMYTIDAEDKLRWHRHLGYPQGTGLDTAGAWAASTEVGIGWGGLTHVFAAGDGVIYALNAQGQLRWYKHDAHLTGAGLETPNAWKTGSGMVVQTEWRDVKQIFAGGNGVIYVITHDGRLLWYRHKLYLDAVPAPWTVERPMGPFMAKSLAASWRESWEGPKEVGSGWNLRHVFSAGDGMIYAVTTDGALRWHKHLAFETGDPLWWQDADGNQFKVIATGWNDVQVAFAVLPGTSDGPIVK